MRRRSLVLCASLLGCQPALESHASLVGEARVLAVRAEPPEAPPSSPVVFQALLASPSGSVSDEALSWAFCKHPRAVAENNSAAPECLAGADFVEPFAEAPSGDAVSALLPADGCALFGSEPAPAEPGEPPNRATDPDASGGYYQPLRVSLRGGEALTIGHVRLRCALPGAPVDIVRAYNERYLPNENPALLGFAAAGDALTVSAGATLELSATWAPESAEPFVVYDASTRGLAERAERLRVSWFASGGAFSAEHGAPAPGADAANVEFRAPAEPGEVHLWAVLRDDRGGVDYRALTLTVTP